MSTRVYLIPGFMGFQSLGELSYFRRVPEMLTQMLQERNLDDVVVAECPTHPSGSIARRAHDVMQWILKNDALKADGIHLIGHSTGGLDARLMTTPGVRLIPGDVEEDVGRLVKSVITISTPHYGTPMANFLLALPFRQTLEKITLSVTSQRGRTMVLLIARIIEALSYLDDFFGRKNTFLDTFVEKTLRNLRKETNDPTWEFLREVAQDQGSTIQLTLESMHLFNAAVADRAGTHYGSVITVAPPQNWPQPKEFLEPIHAIRKLAFRSLYALNSRSSDAYPYTAMEPADLNVGAMDAPLTLDKASNDGIVPCQSQGYGKVLDIVLGDHLDVVGQFPNAGGDTYADWLPCGANFGEFEFKRTWSAIADEIAAVEHGTRARRAASKPVRSKPANRNGTKKAPDANADVTSAKTN